MYDVAFFTGLPVTGKVVEFGEDDLSMTELTTIVRLCMAQYVTENSDKLKREKESKKSVFRNYIKVMKKLLDANREQEKLGLWLSLYVWMVMSGVMFPRTPYRAAWSVQKYMGDVHGMGKYDWVKVIIPVLCPREDEIMVPTVRDFMKIDRFRYYLLDAEEHLKWAREELCVEQGKHIDTEKRLQFRMIRTKELEARLNMCRAHSEHQDAGHQHGGDVGVGIDNESRIESFPWRGNNFRQATEHDSSELKGGEKDAMFTTTWHNLGDSCDGQNMTMRTIDAAAPPEICIDIRKVPQCSEPDAMPFPAVEDVGQTPSDAVGAHGPHGERQHPEPVLGESGALPKTDEGEEGANPEGGVHCVDEVDVARHTAEREGVTMTSASLVGNVEVGSAAGKEGLSNDAMIEPSM
ncbi:hypothetical protein Cgig2_002274 [Carnegiea gigantea]|uniref:Aminotransferase-like plant mobile domain-containing protein n=1 Tax=Carnegiea gigantea TaxID=171969 RepID=A0A9Q1KVR5_9CARY|nr:hypothetical protein Cgig2_002274 [Carnegiea gigantea]